MKNSIITYQHIEDLKQSIAGYLCKSLDSSNFITITREVLKIIDNELPVITTMNDLEVGENAVPNSVSKHDSSLCSLTPSNTTPSFEQRELLKSKCLDIAFRDVDISDSNFRDRAIKNAHKLLTDIELANYYNW